MKTRKMSLKVQRLRRRSTVKITFGHILCCVEMKQWTTHQFKVHKKRSVLYISYISGGSMSVNLLFGILFTENCMKMTKFDWGKSTCPINTPL